MRKTSLFLAGLLTCVVTIGVTLTTYAELVMVPMRDGIQLATEYSLPSGEGPFPVVLSRSVYNRDMGMAFLFHNMGIAYVAQHTRGRGDSEGDDLIFSTDGWGDLQDGVDTVEWLLEQPWCNGKIGTMGPSALSIVQMLLAPATDKLSCQVLWVGDSKFYDHLAYQGGVWRKALCEGWLTAIKSEHMIKVWKSHPNKSAFWSNYDGEAQVEKVTSPGLHVGGWWDIFQQGTINNFTTRQHQGGEGARGNQQLIMGPWPHGPSKKVGDLELPANFMFDFVGHSARFVEYWLTGKDNGIMDEPAVHYYTLGDVEDSDAPGNEWRKADDWPPFETDILALHLQSDGSLTRDPSETAESITFLYDPNDPCPTHGGANLLIDAGPFDQRTIGERDDVVKFATTPLDTPVEVTGNVNVRLFVSSDALDTDFTAKLVDIYPDGREILILDSIQRVKFRKGFEIPDMLPPGIIDEIGIDLWSISIIFNKGHRIGLHVSSSNYPRFDINPNSGDDFATEDNIRTAGNSIHMSLEHPSALLLPIPRIDRETTSK